MEAVSRLGVDYTRTERILMRDVVQFFSMGVSLAKLKRDAST